MTIAVAHANLARVLFFLSALVAFSGCGGDDAQPSDAGRPTDIGQPGDTGQPDTGTVVDQDVDNDGYDATEFGGEDCDDENAAVSPVGVEICDGLDNDCDGGEDEGVSHCTACPECPFDGTVSEHWYAVTTLALPTIVNGAVDGLDLDGRVGNGVGECNPQDAVSPSGVPGIDSAGAAIRWGLQQIFGVTGPELDIDERTDPYDAARERLLLLRLTGVDGCTDSSVEARFYVRDTSPDEVFEEEADGSLSPGNTLVPADAQLQPIGSLGAVRLVRGRLVSSFGTLEIPFTDGLVLPPLREVQANACIGETSLSDGRLGGNGLYGGWAEAMQVVSRGSSGGGVSVSNLIGVARGLTDSVGYEDQFEDLVCEGISAGFNLQAVAGSAAAAGAVD